MKPMRNLLDRLTETIRERLRRNVKAELLHFFAEPDAPYATKRTPGWAKVQTTGCNS